MSLNATNKKVVVIGDVHQNTQWVDAVIARENDADLFVFLGDIFDSYKQPPEITGIRETARWYKRIINNPRCVVLWGNHDVSYMEDWVHAVKRRKNHKPLQKCSGYSRSKSEEIAKELTWQDWCNTKPFICINGWLISHAGFCDRFWNKELSTEQNLQLLYKEAVTARDEITTKQNRWFFSDYLRGGTDAFAGPIWQDFQEVFEDALPLPQIVGHTPFVDPHIVQQIGRSYDIDGRQSCYCILDAHGGIVFKSIARDGAVWIDKPVEVLDISHWIPTRAQNQNPKFFK